MSDDRVLPLDGVHNFRDFGGYAVIGGGRLKRRKLWRSGQHFGATEQDLARIAQLGLTAVYDLRTNDERRSHPCARPVGFNARILLSGAPDWRDVPHLAEAVAPAPPPAAVAPSQVARRPRDPASSREGMRRNYEALPFRPKLSAMIRRMLADLAEGEDAVLVNCMAGKDRTGIAVAAVHLATGVHRDDVLADYLLTNTAGDVEARIRAGEAAIRHITGPLEPDVLRVLMSVDAVYLETAFAAMRERYGSEERWLEHHLGADAALRGRLRARLVDD
jgi:protein-tyrosine phosphatase